MKRTIRVWLPLALAALAQQAGAVEPGFYLGVDGGLSEAASVPSFATIQIGTVIEESTDDGDTAFGLHFGYVISPKVAIEFGYVDAGEVRSAVEREVPAFPTDVTFRPAPVDQLLPVSPWIGSVGVISIPPDFISFPTPRFASVLRERSEQTIETRSLSLSVIGRLPVSQSVSITGKLGIAAHASETNTRFWVDGNPVFVGADRDDSSGAVVVGVGGDWAVLPKLSLRLQAVRHFLVADEGLSTGDIALVTAGASWHF
jgi:hypothetical protein